MLEPYIIALRTAYLAFPFVALVMTLPYILYQYHKYGALLFYRVIVVYTFWFYVLCMCFLVSLPLPTFEDVGLMQGDFIRLTPFQFLTDIRHEADIEVAGRNMETLIAVIKTQSFFEAMANIVMMIPFGIYLHYYFDKKIWKVVFWGFLMSLFFEISQITALFGIYPSPYRYFDVDDLICNTLGAAFGAVITPLCTFFLPKREALDKMSYQKGRNVSFLRRASGMLIDLMITVCVCSVTVLFLNKKIDFFAGFMNVFLVYVIWTILYQGLFAWVTKGQTLGKMWVKIRILGSDGKKASLLNILLRNIIVNLIVMPSPVYAFLSYYLLNFYPSGVARIACVWGIVLFSFIMFVYVIDMFKNVVARDKKMLYDRLAKTSCVSTTSFDNKNFANGT